MSAQDHLGPQFAYQDAQDLAPIGNETVPLHEALPQFHGLNERPENWVGKRTDAPEAVEAISALREHHGKPGFADIYRGVPKEHTSINTGDWVTTSRHYAYEKEGYHVLHARVPTEHVRSEGIDVHEFGYAGPPVPGRVVKGKS